jgi:hypothetical protein
VDHEAAHVADVRDVAVQLEPADEALPGLAAALDDERDDAAEALAAAVLLGALVPRARLETGVVDALHLVTPGEVLATASAFWKWRSMRG